MAQNRFSTQTGEFQKTLSSATHRHDVIRVFGDWLEAAYSAFAKTTCYDPKEAEALEARYMAVVARYSEEPEIIRETFPKLLALTITALHGEAQDFLGVVAGELTALNPSLGQFFTPFALCRLMAKITVIPSLCATLDRQGYVTIQEPASGSGAMIIAAHCELEDAGYEPSECMVVTSIDLSDVAFKMAFLQFHILGIAANVCRGDTLSQEPFYEQAFTGAYRRMQARSFL